jgi:hypothetical protein
VLLNTL